MSIGLAVPNATGNVPFTTFCVAASLERTLEHTAMAGRFRQSQHITKDAHANSDLEARHDSRESSTKRFGALLVALGVGRFLRPRQPNSRQGLAEKTAGSTLGIPSCKGTHRSGR